MNQTLVAIVLTLVGAYVAYLLSKSHGRWKDKKKHISEFSESLKHTLPAIRSGVEGAYLFNSDLTKYLSVLKENELKLGYKLLPNAAKSQINSTSTALKEFVIEFRRLSNHVYSYFERMTNRRGQGSVPMNTIVATKLICMSQDSLPSEKTLINFPRETRGHFSSVQCLPQQVVEIWSLGQQGNPPVA